jgi:hypothetical protein
MYCLFQAHKEKPSNIWELQLSSQVVRLGNLMWTRKSLLPQSARSPRNDWKRGRCCPLHVLVRPGPDVAFLCFVGLFIIAKWLTWFTAKWLIYAYKFTVHLIYQSTRQLEQTLLLIHTLFPSYRVSFGLIRHPKIKLTTYSSFLSFSLRRLLTSSLSPMSQVYHWNFWWIQSIRDSCNSHVCIETRCCERMFFGKLKTFYNKIIILLIIYIKRCWQEGGMFSVKFKIIV